MAAWRLSDQRLAEAENLLREAEYSYPFAWMVGFLVDQEHVLIKALKNINEDDVVEELKRLVHEIETGEDEEDDE